MFKHAKTNDIIHGVVLLLSITEKQSKNGSIYLLLRVRDEEGKEEYMYRWDTRKESFSFQESDFCFVSVEVKRVRERTSYTVVAYRVPDENEYNRTEYLPSAPYNPQDLYQKILEFAIKNVDKEYYELINIIFESNRDKLLKAPAAKVMHHNVFGGLLWHSYAVLQQCYFMTRLPQYNRVPINKSLLFTGAVLHDIGKMDELEIDKIGNVEYSVRGELLGHALIGGLIIQEYAEKINMDPEKCMYVQHLIASHHGKLDYGAIVTPKMVEAQILHVADDLDATLYKYDEALDQVELGEFTERNFKTDRLLRISE